MERPRWAKTVGIIGAILGAAGILGSAQVIFMPKMLEMQREMMQQMSESAKKDGLPALPEFPHQFYEYPDWYERWSLLNGAVGVGLSAGCLLASIFLLTVRPGSPRLFLLFSGLSVFWHGVRLVVGAQAASFMAGSMLPGAIFGIALHGVLVTVVLKSDHSAYSAQAA